MKNIKIIDSNMKASPDSEVAIETHFMVRDLQDIDDFLYQSPAGPITVRDVIYGYGVEIECGGHDFFAHKALRRNP